MQGRSSSIASTSYSNALTSTFGRSSRQAPFRQVNRLWSCRCRKGRHALRISNSAQEVIGVLIFSALPFTAVQTLADSKLGKSLRENVEKNKPRFEKRSREREKQQAEARKRSKWFGPDRPKYLGPIPTNYPQHLRGEAPGDYGFDILNLGASDESFERYYELELIHARWAMLSALGILIPEMLQYSGVSSFGEPRWQYVGYAKLQGEDLNYFGVPGLRIAGNQGVLIIAVCQVLLMFGPEFARSKGVAALEPLGIYLPGDKNYPESDAGGIFDPLEFGKNPEAFEDLRVKEIKNGRLAMGAPLPQIHP